MKKIGNLFEKIVSIENLQLADEHARRGKLKSYGVRIHDKHKEENIKELQTMLLEKSFKTSKYHIFKIYEPLTNLYSGDYSDTINFILTY